MYIARFSYFFLPIHRERAIEFIRREAAAAAKIPLNARVLVPLTRSHNGASLQFEVELDNLEQFDQFRERGLGSEKDTGEWMRAFSEILTAPPTVELLRVQTA